KVATPDFLADLDAVRRTPLDSPTYAAVLQKAVAAGVMMSPSFSLGTVPRIVVRSKRVSPLPHYLSQFRWDGVTAGSS
ncbi:MAG: peptide/nickel transport system substrate-binding protein, partial [Pseudonocardiales bacterium]|nr:peptide/nickel transport system substrate-binding protein [Pseudonocardiales bacterium]